MSIKKCKFEIMSKFGIIVCIKCAQKKQFGLESIFSAFHFYHFFNIILRSIKDIYVSIFLFAFNRRTSRNAKTSSKCAAST
jgi:hypothetical protein